MQLSIGNHGSGVSRRVLQMMRMVSFSCTSSSTKFTWDNLDQTGVQYSATQYRLVAFLRNRLGLKVNGKCETKLANVFFLLRMTFLC